MRPGGWNDPACAALYRAFEERHPRYRRANEALLRHAELPADGRALRVLDLAAGTGGTTAALLPALAPGSRLDCVEPAVAMAQAGRERLGAEPRVRWLRSLAEAQGPYERIVCGAAVWQWPNLERLFKHLAGLLAPGGALVFDIPAAYLGRPDGPGGGRDPYLTELPARAAALFPPQGAAAAVRLSTPAQVAQALAAAGLAARAWLHTQRLTQAAWCDWWQLPPLTQALWPRVPAAERARRIQQAAAGVDRASWRPERWCGWTAWKPAFERRPLVPAPARDPTAMQALARREGVLLLRRLLPAALLRPLRQRVLEVAAREGLLDRQGRSPATLAAAAHEMPGWVGLQQQVQGSAEFAALLAAPALRQVFATLLRSPALADRGHIVRIAPPERFVPATPLHRDADYLRGAGEVWGAWIPLVPCDASSGVLAVVPRSHCDAGATRLALSAMRPGDVLLLSSRTLHRACPNRQWQRARISVDLRFAAAPAT